MIEPRLSDEHALLRATIRQFVDDKIRPVARELEASGEYPDEIVAGMAEIGLFGLTVPEDYGGMGADTLALAIVFEEISRGWMGIAGVLGTHTLACRLIAQYGSEEQRSRYLPDLAIGVRRSGLALSEPDAGTDLQGIQTIARRDGDDYLISGSKQWITNARHADPLPVLVKTDAAANPPHRGMSILLIEAQTPGFEISRDIGKLGYRGPETCEVSLDDVRVPNANLLGEREGRGLQQALSVLELGRVNVAARAVGVAFEALAQAREYSLQREAFGQRISNFQAIQLHLARMGIRTQTARLATWWAANRVDEGARADAETALAKYVASEAAAANALDSMRVHGGIGYSTELEIERLYRDAPLMIIGEGTNEIMQLIVAQRILDQGFEWLS